MFSSILVTGPDAGSFLQGQLTQDLHSVNTGHSPLAAWCTPQGRVIAVMRLVAVDSGFRLVLPKSLVSVVIEGLQRYRLRANVTFGESGSEWQAAAVANEADLAMLQAGGLLPDKEADCGRQAGDVAAVCLDDERQTVELYGDLRKLQLQMPLSDDSWQEARLRAGIADLGPASSGKFTPHMLNLDRLGAVSFSKGCYAGQEIVARTQHLGNSKRRIAAFSASRNVAAGSKIDLDGTAVGEVVASAGRALLALLPLELHQRDLAADGVSLAPLNP